ncbi:MAG: B12-binding domain-containing radical SAM protein [Eubacteriales bacterium]|nr:B12-binding domain-containing radical SAM protein [Eubacteriales bacterium]
MKILLTAVNAKYIHSNLAVYSLKAYANAYAGGENNIELAEYTINHRVDEILQDLFKKKPDILAFSCYIWNMDIIEKLLPDLAKVLPGTKIWAGGPEVSYDAEEFLQEHPEVTGVMAGEGEETFCELVQGKNPKQIKGLIFRDNEGKILRTPSRPCMDMDRLPFPYNGLEELENRIIYYESSRGCPFSCSYCLSSIDKSVRFRSTETVKRELQFFLNHKVPQVKFVDRTFNCRHSHSLELWRYIKEHDNGITNFHFEIAADILNEEELAVLESMRPGLVQLEIGVQSTNLQTIKEIDRVMDFEHLKAIVKRLQRAENIHLHLDLIAGLPWEDYESFVNSFNDVYNLHPEQLQLGFLKVLKGSKMHQKAQEYGICYHTDPVYEVFSTRWISYEEILRLKDVEEMLEVYYNSNQFANTVRYLEKEFETPYRMFEELAMFHAEKGYSGQKISRQARFEILREFIRSRTEETVYDELLLLDLYLRENSKSRPEWAPDLSIYKKTVYEFFGREEEKRKFLPDYEGRSAKQLMHMTHMEKFGTDICETGVEGEHWILFDYRRRNPLTQDAYIQDVSEGVKNDD